MRHVLRERQQGTVLANADQAATKGGLERTTSGRVRALVAVGAAILSFGLLTGTANASTLSASQNFPYSGTFAPPIMENLLGSSAGCANGTETNCQFFQFVVNEPGCTATT